MKKKLLVINAVGLTESLINDDCPNLKYYFEKNRQYLKPPLPAVTCTSQATLLTGKSPQEHGIVANGWYFRDLAQVWPKIQLAFTSRGIGGTLNRFPLNCKPAIRSFIPPGPILS